MKIVVFGLAVSSSWGNGHATLWRGLGRALGGLGHELVFFERDVPYYAAHRDGTDFPGIQLELYRDRSDLRRRARVHLDAEVAMVTSFCPEGGEVAALVLDSRAELRVFYDLDTPVTLARLDAGERVDYLPRGGLGGFDLVLSYTGGRALTELENRLGARRTAPLYGSVDPTVHRPGAGCAAFAGDLSHLGTYSADRAAVLEALFLEPARRAPGRRFPIAGSLYPPGLLPAGRNVTHLEHLVPADHPAFFASSPLTLNVTRAPMAAMGFCPSGRLFEATACGAAVVSDEWEGLGSFFSIGEEILIARSTDDVLAAMALPRAELERLGRRGRERTLDLHTAEHRARELEGVLDAAAGAVASEFPLAREG